MPRLFIALPVEAGAGDSLRNVYEFLSGLGHQLKPVETGNYHITVKFLGECGGDLAEKIETSFTGIAVPPGAIPFSLAGTGAFPDLKRPNVIWAGLKIDDKLIGELYHNIEEFAAGFGFEREKRKFSPHLTLARVRKGKVISAEVRDFIIKNKDTKFADSSFKRLVLFSSNLTPKGPVYTALKSIVLQ